MTKLEKLLEELCPNGVEYKLLAEVVSIERGKRVVREQLSESGGYPVYQNSLTPLGYHTENNYPAGSTFIIVAGAAGEIGYSTVDFWAADDCFSLVCPDYLLNRYIYHVVMNQRATLQGQVRKASIPRLPRSAIDKLVVPVPPVEVQSEIICILDAFFEKTNELSNSLEAERVARRKQYEYYRDKLLTFDVATERKQLGELFDIVDYRGKTPAKTDSGVFLVTAKNIRKGYIDYETSKEYISLEDYDEAMHRGKPKIGDLLFTTEAPCGNVALVDREDIALAQRVIKYRPKNKSIISTRYAKHYLLGAEFQKRLEKASTGETVKGIKGSKLHQMDIPVPSIEVQLRVADVLDNFESFCTSINIELPSEIDARAKQYEYYRDLLLTFADGSQSVNVEREREREREREQGRGARMR